jgi:hypothetical protein
MFDAFQRPSLSRDEVAAVLFALVPATITLVVIRGKPSTSA